MKILPILLVFILTDFVAFAQQNLFNVPSSDITIAGEPFFQQQINLYSNQYQLNSTFCWGLGNQTEVGVNVLELNFATRHPHLLSNSDLKYPPTYPIFTVNVQKAYTLTRYFKISAGMQNGFSCGYHFVNYSFCNLVTAIPNLSTKLVAGIYAGTNSFLGSESRNSLSSHSPIGWHLGLEEQIMKDKFSIIAEHISGNHALGESSLGAAYYLSENWILSAAFMLANSRVSTENAVIAEITFSPSSKVHLKLFKRGHQSAKA